MSKIDESDQKLIKEIMLDSKNQSDLYGRINGLKNTFILDSLILPNIYANTTTFTSLANIVRIVDILSKKSIKKK